MWNFTSQLSMFSLSRSYNQALSAQTCKGAQNLLSEFIKLAVSPHRRPLHKHSNVHPVTGGSLLRKKEVGRASKSSNLISSHSSQKQHLSQPTFKGWDYQRSHQLAEQAHKTI